MRQELILPVGVHAARYMLVYHPGLSSWAISKEGLPWGGFCHAMNLLRDGTVIDARSDKQPCVKDGKPRAGVQNRPHDYIDWTRVLVIEIPLSAALEATWEAWLHAQVGDDYDGAAIWGFIRGVRLHLRKHWICSALCMGSGRRVGIFHSGHVSLFQDSDISPDVLAAIATCSAGGRIAARYGLTA